MSASNAATAAAVAAVVSEQDSNQSSDFPATEYQTMVMTQAADHLSRATSNGSSVSSCSRMSNGMFQFVDFTPFTAFPTLFPYVAEAGGDNNNMNANRSMLHSTTTSGGSMGSLSFLLKSGDTSLMASCDSNNQNGATNNKQQFSFPDASAFLAMYEQVLSNPSSKCTATNNANTKGTAPDYTANKSNVALPPLPIPVSLRGVSDPVSTGTTASATELKGDPNNDHEGMVNTIRKPAANANAVGKPSLFHNKPDSKIAACKKKRVPSYKVATTMQRRLSLQYVVRDHGDNDSRGLFPPPQRRSFSSGFAKLPPKESVMKEKKDDD